MKEIHNSNRLKEDSDNIHQLLENSVQNPSVKKNEDSLFFESNYEKMRQAAIQNFNILTRSKPHSYKDERLSEILQKQLDFESINNEDNHSKQLNLQENSEEEEISSEQENSIHNDSNKLNQNKIRNSLKVLENDLKHLEQLLSKKRENLSSTTDDTILDEYDLFQLNFNNNIKDFNACKTIDVPNLNKNFKINNDNNDKKNEKKIIGLTQNDIYNAKRYKINIQNLPKFSKIFDEVANGFDYNSNKLYNFSENEFEGKIRNKQSVSFVEKQNSEALKLIEEKRNKFRHFPKASKDKMDNNNLHKQWSWIAKKEIPKIHKIYQKYKNDLDYNCRKFSTLVQKEVKKKVVKVQRLQKESVVRAKKLQKEMIIFWRKRDKEIIELRKKKDKVEVEKKKKEDELNEMIIQKKRLDYLMKQSDIYSFFMIRNMGIADVVNTEEHKQDDQMETEDDKKFDNAQSAVIGNNEVMVNSKTNKVIFKSIKVEIDEKAAKEGVKQIIKAQREKMMKFDQQTNRIRETLGGDGVKIKNFNDINEVDMAVDKLNNPEINNLSSQKVEVPSSFLGELKEYQLKGLRWLDNLYDQGINGILADEMGLGKTVQAISFLSHLSEEKNNWGPFLVVAPNATLYNWQQELNKFCPSLKVLPYWGGMKERKTLRKFFQSQNLYTKSAQFHVCITSYQLVVSDEKVFNRVNWQYMVLDEAQAIKNINSQRWNTLLSFNCRNRLLLSGTPIQNSMSELWALLHFIMPNLFDSHEQFQEWFSKDIEAHSQDKGELNHEQLNRLHKILKPFMLRRVKKDVENEIGPKFEYEILCDMTERQTLLYSSIKEKLTNISDLFTSVDSKLKVENLMNLVMQFRKVCNHPEIFERNLGKVPFIFRDLVNSRSSTFLGAPNTPAELRTDTGNLIKYTIPKLIFDELFLLNAKCNKFSIFTNENIVNSSNKINSLFNFFGLLNFSFTDFSYILSTDTFIAQICLAHYLKNLSLKNCYSKNQNIFNGENVYKNKVNIFISNHVFSNYEENLSLFQNNILTKTINQPFIYSLLDLKNTYSSKFTKHRIYISKALANPIELQCSSNRTNTFIYNNFYNNLINKILYGQSHTQFNKSNSTYHQKYLQFKNYNKDCYISEQLEKGFLTELFYNYEGFSQVEPPSFERLVSDCAKLKKLDQLLARLKKEGHRVLIFCQMTRMLDILEEYMSKRRYSYFRMDGSTQIADRRDMINEFQYNPKVFSFLLSTRAGGLGVNLTGADTVIFYDNDWNPTMDAQATDRAHRIGQTKPVSVYRLITKNTIEERILKRAKQKQNVQTTVYAGGAFKADVFKQSEIVELLYSEEEVNKIELERKKLIELGKQYNLEVGVKNIVDEQQQQTSLNKKGKKSNEKKVKKRKSGDQKKEETAAPKQNIKNIFAVSNSNSIGNKAFKVES